MAKGPAVAIRKSTRIRNTPQRMVPNSDLPSDIQRMIHEAAATTAAKSDVPFAPEAVSMLEQALCVPPYLSTFIDHPGTHLPLRNHSAPA